MPDTHSTYFLVNFFSIIFPLLFSFHPRFRFITTWKAFLPAILTTAVFFIIWDAFFIYIKVWAFNPRYVSGIWFLGMPLEEILFFLCIPYACVFTYFCLKKIRVRISSNTVKFVTNFLIAFLTIMTFLFSERVYTSVTFSLTALALWLCVYIFKFSFMGRFYLAYLILLIPFTITNGILTGSWITEPVVLYNPDEIIGFRILTIPFEDTIYGMLLILINVALFERFSNKLKKHD